MGRRSRIEGRGRDGVSFAKNLAMMLIILVVLLSVVVFGIAIHFT